MKFNHIFHLVNQNNARTYESDGITATLRFVSQNCLRVTIGKKLQDLDNNDGAALKETAENTFTFGDVTVKVDVKNFLLTYYKDGKRLFADRAPQSYNLENEFGHGIFHYVTREPDEKIYGLGDKGGDLNKAGRSFQIETTDSMGYDGEHSDPLYKHVPFYICDNSIGSYGIYYNTTATSYLDFGREHNNYYEHYKYFRSEDDILDYYVFFGTKLEILQTFGRSIGKNAFPPKWSFDYCASTMAYTDADNAYEEMLAFIEKLKEYNLSCRGFYLSSGYTSIGNQRCVFNWNYEKFPDPKEFIRVFKENGIEIIPNIKPSFLVTHPMYPMLKEKGFFIQNPDGTPFVTQLWDNLGSYLDFTNPGAYAFWKSQVRKKLLNLGITSTWNDNNEFDIKDPDAITFSGEKASRIRPKLTYLMDEASYQAQTESYPLLRPFLSTRSGGAAVRRLAQTWSGDNFTSFKDLRFCHYIGLTMSLSGFYFYGHDLGGFSGAMPSRELLLRWLQHGVFEPRFTIHSWNSDGSATMPWSYPDIMPQIRALFAQRKKMIPYLYQCAYEAVENELPMNAPLFLYYNDEDIEQYSDCMMVGRNILVPFVFDEGADITKAYLPKDDDWYLDNEYFAGGQEVNVPLSCNDTSKYFVKAGSVIPTDEAPYGFQSEEQLVLTVYPKKQGCFNADLFFDDGLTYSYLQNECARLHIKVQCTKDEVIAHIENSGKNNVTYDIRLCEGDQRPLIIK